MIVLDYEEYDKIMQIPKKADEDGSKRVGRRIKNVREFLGLSQAELGQRVGLPAERIQKYESGFRKPRPDLLIEIAKALGVTPLALADVDLESPLGAMHALFRYEETYGFDAFLQNENGQIILDQVWPDYIYYREWETIRSNVIKSLEYARDEEERNKILREYQMWKWRFPFSASETPSQAADRRKSEIRNKIKELEAELRLLENHTQPNADNA